jgi:hypothetical protein
MKERISTQFRIYAKALGGSGGAGNGYMGTLGLFNEYRVVYQAPSWVAAPIRPAS